MAVHDDRRTDPGERRVRGADVRNSRGQVQSPRERAAHYRKYAAQFRALARGEQNESLREKLMQIVRQYEEQANDLDPKPG